MTDRPNVPSVSRPEELAAEAKGETCANCGGPGKLYVQPEQRRIVHLNRDDGRDHDFVSAPEPAQSSTVDPACGFTCVHGYGPCVLARHDGDRHMDAKGTKITCALPLDHPAERTAPATTFSATYARCPHGHVGNERCWTTDRTANECAADSNAAPASVEEGTEPYEAAEAAMRVHAEKHMPDTDCNPNCFSDGFLAGVKYDRAIASSDERLTDERIVAAAILAADGKTIHVHPRPLSRHGVIMQALWNLYGKHKIGMENQGFITSEGRFVGRAEAAQIAYAAGQIPRQNELLMSEDVW